MLLVGNREGVIVTDKSGELPHPSTILDIYSTSKGVLFPSMTSLQQNSISPQTNGLIVYVNDENNNKGFWFWSNIKNKWLQLSTTLPGSNELTLPNGSIIMYVNDSIKDRFDASGKGIKGTETEGWTICNGFNGAPLMNGFFLRGYDNSNLTNKSILETGGSSSHTISEQHMPSHSHKISDITIDATHSHKLSLEHKDEHMTISQRTFRVRKDKSLPFKRTKHKNRSEQ